MILFTTSIKEELIFLSYMPFFTPLFYILENITRHNQYSAIIEFRYKERKEEFNLLSVFLYIFSFNMVQVP